MTRKICQIFAFYFDTHIEFLTVFSSFVLLARECVVPITKWNRERKRAREKEGGGEATEMWLLSVILPWRWGWTILRLIWSMWVFLFFLFSTALAGPHACVFLWKHEMLAAATAAQNPHSTDGFFVLVGNLLINQNKTPSIMFFEDDRPDRGRTAIETAVNNAKRLLDVASHCASHFYLESQTIDGSVSFSFFSLISFHCFLWL